MPGNKAERERDRRWLPVVTACCGLIGAAMWVSVLLPTGSGRRSAAAPDGTTEPTAATTATTTATGAPTTATVSATFPQLLRVWEGRLARFAVDGEQLLEVYDAEVAALPPEEQQRLADGVLVANEEELAALLENYTS